MKAISVLAAALALIACGKDGGRAAREESAANPVPPPGASAVDQPHVVFTRASLVIDRIGAAVPAPVTSASRPAPDTMTSDDPGVIQVGADGSLVARGVGSTVVRARTGASSLQVSVVAPSAISIEPQRMELASNDRVPVQVFDSDGAQVPAEAVHWLIPQGVPIGVVGGQVHGMGRPGTFEIQAEVGAARASLHVTVRQLGSGELRVHPEGARFRRGEVRVLQAVTSGGGVAAEWTSENHAVLESLGRGLFQAKKSGKSKVCASALGQSACSIVEVMP